MTFDSRGGPIPVDVELVRRGTDWRIDDLAADGIRLTDSYRAQVDRILSHGGFKSLLDRIDERQKALTAAPPRAAARVRPPVEPSAAVVNAP